MPRNMSFMLTTEQFRNQTKTVTRRLGWKFLRAGDILNGCEKCQGLKKGEKVNKLGQIRVINIRREPLYMITDSECALEGFPHMSAAEFIDFFCDHNKCKPYARVSRIEFEYLDEPDEKQYRPNALQKGSFVK